MKEKIDVAPSGNGVQFTPTLNPETAVSLGITVKANGTTSEETLTFTQKQVQEGISHTVEPTSGKQTIDGNIIVTFTGITGPFFYKASDDKIKVSSTGNVVTITASEAVNGTVTIGKQGMENVVLPVQFLAYSNIIATGYDSAVAPETNMEILVSSPENTNTLEASVTKGTAQVTKQNTKFILTGTTEESGVITITDSSNTYATLQIPYTISNGVVDTMDVTTSENVSVVDFSGAKYVSGTIQPDQVTVTCYAYGSNKKLTNVRVSKFTKGQEISTGNTVVGFGLKFESDVPVVGYAVVDFGTSTPPKGRGRAAALTTKYANATVPFSITNPTQPLDATITPTNAEERLNGNITVRFNTTGVEHAVSDSKITVNPDSAKQSFTITSSQAVAGQVAFTKAGYSNKNVDVRYTQHGNVTLEYPNGNSVPAGNSLLIVLPGVEEALQVSSSNPHVQVEYVASTKQIKVTSQTEQTAIITIKGNTIATQQLEVTFTARLTLEYRKEPTSNIKQGKAYTITITTDVGGKTILASTQGNTRVEKAEHANVFTVVSEDVISDSVTFRCQGYDELIVPVEWIKGDIVQTQVSPSASVTENEQITITVTGTSEVIEAESQDPAIATTRVEGNKVIVTCAKPGSVDIKIKGAGIAPSMVRVTFTQAEVVPGNKDITADVSPVGGSVYVGETISITTDVDLSAGFTITGETDTIKWAIDDQDVRVLNITATKNGSTSIRISKAGYNTLVVPVVFKAQSSTLDSINFYMSEKEPRTEITSFIQVVAWYNDKIIKCKTTSPGANVKALDASYIASKLPNGQLSNFVATTFVLTSTQVGKKKYTFETSDGITYDMNIDFYEEEVNEEMSLHGKKLILLKGQENYINAEVTDTDEDVQVTSKGITTGDITFRQDTNRLYFKGVNPGQYDVVVKSSKYRDSKFRVIVKDEEYVEKVVLPKTYYDLGEAPVDTRSFTNDDFLTKVMSADTGWTDAQRLAFILSRAEQFPGYSNIVNVLCGANASIVNPAYDLFTAKRKNAVSNVLYILDIVLSNEDYITFKQSMLAVKLAFRHYGTAGLTEDKLKSYVEDEKYTLLSDLYTYISKDIANDLASINIKTMSSLLTHKMKDRLTRYALDNNA